MQKLIADVDAKFGAVKDADPQFAGKKALLLGGTLQRGGVQVSAPRLAHEFLTGIGLTVVDTDESLIPRERMAEVLGSADVLIWTTESDEERAALLADPTIAGLPAKQIGATCSPARSSQGRSPTPRHCRIRWWLTGCRRCSPRRWADLMSR